jgi:hypothetical protein
VATVALALGWVVRLIFRYEGFAWRFRAHSELLNRVVGGLFEAAEREVELMFRVDIMYYCWLKRSLSGTT